MLEAYRSHVDERAELGIPPLPLNPEQTSSLVELLKNPPAGEGEFLLDLLINRIPPGVDEAAYVKAAFLAAISTGDATSPLIDKKRSVELLGTMLGMLILVDEAFSSERYFACSLSVGGITDNNGNRFAVTKMLTTK